ncbi:MAG: hypothetical protein GXX96_02415 [Planctomycetaceae bacterium]|nr:hypothetical protein [Planctomycetaceae bacterium]
MGKRILLVEGNDDRHVMWNLFEVRNVAECFDVKCPESQSETYEDGGIDNLLGSIPYWLASSDLERLAIVVDADSVGPDARWEAIRHRLEKAGYDGLPARHSQCGAVFDLSLQPHTPRSVRFGLWIMPDNQSTGMLEDFVAKMIHEGDEMLPPVDGFLASIPQESRRFSPAHQSKARLHTWLAVSERPGRPMGQAIKADRYLDANHASVEPFLSWLREALVD